MKTNVYAKTSKQSSADTATTDTAFSIGLTLTSLAPRLYAALAWAKEPVWDGHYYHFGATRIAAGLGYSEDIMVAGLPRWNPWCHYPVGYSGFLGAFYKVFGSQLWVAPVLNALVGAATVWLVYHFAKLCLSPWRARIAGVLCAVHPGLILYSAVVMSEPLAASSMLLAGYLAVRFSDKLYGPLLAGAALGCSVLVRPTGLLVAPLLFFAFGGRFQASLAKAAMAKTAAATLCTFLVIAPWSYRNCRVMDGCALVSTNGGWNLAIGAISNTGRFDTLKASDGCPVVTGQVQQDRCWAAVGTKRILQDPARWLGLMPLKLRHTYNHESFAAGYLGEADPSAWPESRRAWWRERMTFFHHALMLLSCVAAFRLVPARGVRDVAFWLQCAGILLVFAFARWALLQPEPPLYWLIAVVPFIALLPLPGSENRNPRERFLFTLVAMTTVTHAVFFGDDRYHLTVTPILCILAAAALRFGESTGGSPNAHSSSSSNTRGYA